MAHATTLHYCFGISHLKPGFMSAKIPVVEKAALELPYRHSAPYSVSTPFSAKHNLVLWICNYIRSAKARWSITAFLYSKSHLKEKWVRTLLGPDCCCLTVARKNEYVIIEGKNL